MKTGLVACVAVVAALVAVSTAEPELTETPTPTAAPERVCPTLKLKDPQVLEPEYDPAVGKLYFGKYIRVSGRWLIVGGYGCNNYQGCAFMFKKQGSKFVYQQTIEPEGGEKGDHFGLYTAISGSVAAVSAPYSEIKGPDTGAVHVYDLKSGVWEQTDSLSAPDQYVTEGMLFGYGFGMEGKWIVVGARYASHLDADGNVLPGGLETGAIFVFYREKGMDKFEFKQAIHGDHEHSQFGDDVVILGTKGKKNGKPKMIVSAPRYPPNDKGATFVYAKKGKTWVDPQLLQPDESDLPYTTTEQHHGEGLAAGAACVVTGGEMAPSDQGTRTGAAYLWEQVNGVWTQTQNLFPIYDGAGRHAQRVAVYNDELIVAGTWGAKVDGVKKAGEVLTWVKCSDNSWERGPTIKAPVPTENDQFGNVVDLRKEYLLIGVPKADSGDDDTVTDRGAVYNYGFELVWP